MATAMVSPQKYFTVHVVSMFQLMDTHTADPLDPTLDFLAGTAAGVSGLVVGFPFDTGESGGLVFCNFVPSDWRHPSSTPNK
jgi:hypothetical protein